MSHPLLPGIEYRDDPDNPRIVIELTELLPHFGLECNKGNALDLYAAVVDLLSDRQQQLRVDLADAHEQPEEHEQWEST